MHRFAMGRWADGYEAGWKITRREDWTRTSSNDFLEQGKCNDVTRGALKETRTVTFAALSKTVAKS
jgi:hypothetical protein